MNPRDNQELLYLLAESSNDVLWTMSITGEITYVSPAVERMRGYTPEEAMAQPLHEIQTPESVAITQQYFVDLMTALAEGREPPSNFRGEIEYYCKDGSTVWTELQVIPHFSPDGELLEILGVTRDISERKAQEDEVRRMREMAEAERVAAERERSRKEERERMARDLHDDLLQSLSAVKVDIATAELRSAGDPDRARETLERSREELTRAIESARRLVTGLRARELEGRDLVEALEALVAEADRRHAASFSFRCDARDLGTLSPDATECLYRIAQESLSNAARHAEARTVAVTLTRTPEGHARLRVEDDGRGFDDAQAVRDDAFGVLGMRERDVALGGRVSIEGRPGEGTRVEAAVPLAG
jgi:PAS domain S-box-containing protein